MSIAFVKEVHSITFSPASASSLVLPSITPAMGNLLVAWIESLSSSPSISSDTGGNSWTQVGTTQPRSGSGYYIAMFAAVATGSASVVTFSIPGGGYPNGQIMEFSGTASSGPIDASGQAAGIGTSPTCAVVTNNANELIVAASCPNSGGTWGPAAGWNQPNGTNPTGGLTYGGIFATEATAGTYNPTFTVTSDQWGIIAGSFKHYTAPPPSTAVPNI